MKNMVQFILDFLLIPTVANGALEKFPSLPAKRSDNLKARYEQVNKSYDKLTEFTENLDANTDISDELVDEFSLLYLRVLIAKGMMVDYQGRVSRISQDELALIEFCKGLPIPELPGIDLSSFKIRYDVSDFPVDGPLWEPL